MYATSISKLIKKIEKGTGTRLMNLPPELCKDVWWEEVIKPITLSSFSRMYPHMVLYSLIPSRDKHTREGEGTPSSFYYIDEHRLPGEVEIIGIKDLSREAYLRELALNPYGPSGGYSNDVGTYSPLDIAQQQTFSDLASLYNTGLRIEVRHPNMIRVTCGNFQNMLQYSGTITLELYVSHQDLVTISPMKMETIETLALYDIQNFLYQELKFFDGLESIYGGNIDLKMSEWAQAESKRQDFVNGLKDKFINAGNTYVPIMISV